MRRYTWLTLGFTAAIFTLTLVFSLSTRLMGAPQAIVLGVVACLLAPQYVRFSAFGMPGLGKATARPGEIPVTVALAVGAWLWVAAVLPEAVIFTFIPALILGALIAADRPIRRWPVSLAAGIALALAGLAVTTAAGHAANTGWLVVITITVPLITATNALQIWLWSVVRQLDEARHMAAELAVAEERLRFATELHDIQGHHLQAIALKGELAERLIGHDDAAARVQASELTELARTALRETRAVVHGYRRSSLSTEIGNAVDILRAAGISATVRGDAAEVPPPLQPLFGALVREGTTNVLRHSTATECAVTVAIADGRVRVDVRNDGVRASAVVPGSGILGLRERFATVGGVVRAECSDDAFRLTGEAVTP